MTHSAQVAAFMMVCGAQWPLLLGLIALWRTLRYAALSLTLMIFMLNGLVFWAIIRMVR